MLSALVIGDPHFKVSNAIDTDLMCKAIYQQIEKLNPDIIVVLGDILDRHEAIHVDPLSRSINFLRKLSIERKVYILIGNHDRKNNSDFLSEVHPFTALKQWNSIIIVDKVIIDTVNGHKLVFVPYVPPGRFQEALSTVEGKEKGKEKGNGSIDDATVIFAHQEFKDAKMGAILSTEGDEWDKAILIISGHIHDYDELSDYIIYVGVPFQHAYGDKDDKTISFFTFNEYKTYTHVRIDLGLPKKILARIEAANLDKFIVPKNSQVKLVITGTTEELKVVMKMSKIKQLMKAGVKIAYKHKRSSIYVHTNIEQQERQKFITQLIAEIGDDQTQLAQTNRMMRELNMA